MLCLAGLEEESQDTVCELVKFSSETNLCEVHPRDVLAIYVAQPPNIDVERKGFQANIPQARCPDVNTCCTIVDTGLWL